MPSHAALPASEARAPAKVVYEPFSGYAALLMRRQQLSPVWRAGSAVLVLAMRLLIRFAVVFALVGVASLVLMQVFGADFGTANYWDAHGLGLLLGLALLPRLTLLLSSIATGGLLWWLGWLVAPRMLVATLATVSYFETNPALVVIAWLIALSGESSEKCWLRRRSRASALPNARVVSEDAR